ncbi:MAG: SRPBCC family protein [Saprospiraceae bacterium]
MFQAKISTQIQIKASPGAVWDVLTNFQEYPNWNPFLTEVSGTLAKGESLKINAGGMRFKPKILRLETSRELQWLGHLFFTGLFDGTHHFLLNENSDGSTQFIHCENFSGILIPLFRGKLLRDTKNNFEKMNRALKNLVEQKNNTQT